MASTKQTKGTPGPAKPPVQTSGPQPQSGAPIFRDYAAI